MHICHICCYYGLLFLGKKYFTAFIMPDFCINMIILQSGISIVGEPKMKIQDPLSKQTLMKSNAQLWRNDPDDDDVPPPLPRLHRYHSRMLAILRLWRLWQLSRGA
jgi:hypothetical protein